MCPCNDANRLPTISFIGGATKTFNFNIFSSNGKPVDVTSCRAEFSLISSTEKNGPPLLKKDMTVSLSSSNILTVSLEKNDTINLYGKYIYQVSIIYDQLAEEPMQGDLYIDLNIDKSFYS